MVVKGPDHAQAKKEHKAFISDPVRSSKFITDAMQYGWFVAIEQARIKGTMGIAHFHYEYRRYYEMMGESLKKGESHTTHIVSALKRMAATARRGAHRLDAPGVSMAPDDAAFQRDLLAFQGWLASLYEVYVTLFCFIEGSNGATRKVEELAAAANALIQKRLAEKDGIAPHPELFRAMTEL